MIKRPLIWYCVALSCDQAPSPLISSALSFDRGDLFFEAFEDDLEAKDEESGETNGTMLISMKKSIIRDQNDIQVHHPFNYVHPTPINIVTCNWFMMIIIN